MYHSNNWITVILEKNNTSESTWDEMRGGGVWRLLGQLYRLSPSDPYRIGIFIVKTRSEKLLVTVKLLSPFFVVVYTSALFYIFSGFHLAVFKAIFFLKLR